MALEMTASPLDALSMILWLLPSHEALRAAMLWEKPHTIRPTGEPARIPASKEHDRRLRCPSKGIGGEKGLR
jgi:hypothetical protein